MELQCFYGDRREGVADLLIRNKMLQEQGLTSEGPLWEINDVSH